MGTRITSKVLQDVRENVQVGFSSVGILIVHQEKFFLFLFCLLYYILDCLLQKLTMSLVYIIAYYCRILARLA